MTAGTNQAEARAHAEEIARIVAVAATAEENDDATAREVAEQELRGIALAVRIRSGWYEPGSDPEGPAQYEILLSPGGPACRIVGSLDAHCEPEGSPELQAQDWLSQWQRVPIGAIEHDALVVFVGLFSFAG